MHSLQDLSVPLKVAETNATTTKAKIYPSLTDINVNVNSKTSNITNNVNNNHPKLVILPKSESFHSYSILERQNNNLKLLKKDKFNNHPHLHQKIIKQKSDYALSTIKKNRNLYENLCNEVEPLIESHTENDHRFSWHEVHNRTNNKDFDDYGFDEYDDRVGDVGDEIKLTRNDNNVLVFTTKKADDYKKGARNKQVPLQSQQQQQQQQKYGIEVEESSLTGNNYTSVSIQKSSSHKWRHSWYAPIYGILEEESEHNFKESSSLHNLAGVRKSDINGTHESASLLEPTKSITTSTNNSSTTIFNSRVPRTNTTVCIVPSGNNDVVTQPSLAAPTSLVSAAAVPRKRKFEQFLKNLVNRRPSKEPSSPPLISSPEIKVSKSPSERNLTQLSKRLTDSTTSLNSMHHKLWSVVPLLRKNGSCGSLQSTPRPTTFQGVEYQGLRKCETVLALTQSHQLEPIKPMNRLRNCGSIATCSRCSSLLSLAAGSKYSLNVSSGGFVPVNNSSSCSGSSHANNNGGIGCVNNSLATGLMTPQQQQRLSGFDELLSAVPEAVNDNNSSSIAASSVASLSHVVVNTTANATTTTILPHKNICKLCLGEYKVDNMTRIGQCGCSFCTECMSAYVEFEISEGAYEVSCPDAMCPAQGVISIGEITMLAAPSLVEKHHRYRLNREVELDKFRTWCPKAGCETICLVGPAPSEKMVTFQSSSSTVLLPPCAVHCPTCRDDFCSGCKKPWHPLISCEENTKQLAASGKIETLGIPFESDLIKCCPMCSVPIEKDEGCAQMMCKRCKHVFCWYCLASLDDDFLLRHYDKGPCKNKLGHSRASVVWHRAQVIGIFAGFGILLLVASPLLLLAAPCIVCCKCRICSGAAKLDEPDAELDDAITLQR